MQVSDSVGPQISYIMLGGEVAVRASVPCPCSYCGAISLYILIHPTKPILNICVCYKHIKHICETYHLTLTKIMQNTFRIDLNENVLTAPINRKRKPVDVPTEKEKKRKITPVKPLVVKPSLKKTQKRKHKLKKTKKRKH
jgi:hypothetical protein